MRAENATVYGVAEAFSHHRVIFDCCAGRSHASTTDYRSSDMVSPAAICKLKQPTLSVNSTCVAFNRNNSRLLAAYWFHQAAISATCGSVPAHVISRSVQFRATSASASFSSSSASKAEPRHLFISAVTAAIFDCRFWKEPLLSPSWLLAVQFVPRRLPNNCCLFSAFVTHSCLESLIQK